MRFVFRNKLTGETKTAAGHSLNAAARSVGIEAVYRAPLPEPWMPWECWDHEECQWHYTPEGECISGSRD